MSFDLAHGLRVARRFHGLWPLYLAALLHDAIEEKVVSARQLEAAGLPRSIRDVVATLTRVSGETYADYIERVATNPDAIDVKIADLEDNLARMDDEHESLRPRYEKALARLHGARS